MEEPIKMATELELQHMLKATGYPAKDFKSIGILSLAPGSANLLNVADHAQGHIQDVGVVLGRAYSS